MDSDVLLLHLLAERCQQAGLEIPQDSELLGHFCPVKDFELDLG